MDKERELSSRTEHILELERELARQRSEIEGLKQPWSKVKPASVISSARLSH